MQLFNRIIPIFFFAIVTATSPLKANDELVISVPSQLEFIDPVRAWSFFEMLVVGSYCRSLTTINSAGGLEGQLLKSWSISKDHTTYTFVLKDNIKFHDGSKVTSEDVAFSFSRHFWPEYDSSMRHQLKFAVGHGDYIPKATYLENIKIIDSQKFSFSLPKPYLPFLSMLSQTLLCVVKKDSQLIGSGPMEVKKIANGWKLTRVPDGPPDSGEIKIIKVVSQISAQDAMKSFKEKKVDLIIGNHLVDYNHNELGDLQTLKFPSVNHILLNPNSKTLKDKMIRKWIGQVFQAVAWKKDNIPRAQTVCRSLIPTGYFSIAKSPVVEKLPDILSRKPFKEWPHKTPLEISLVKRFFSDHFFEDLKKTLEAAQIPFVLTKLDGPEWARMVEKGNFEITNFPLFLSYYDPDGLFINIQTMLTKEQNIVFENLSNFRNSTDSKVRMQGYLEGLLLIENEWVIVPAYRIELPYLKTDELSIPGSFYRNQFEIWLIRRIPGVTK